MKKQGLTIFLILISVLGISGCNHQKVAPSDTVLIHAKIYTVNSKEPWAQAMAVREGKIIAVGSDKTIAAYQGPSTKVIEMGKLADVILISQDLFKIPPNQIGKTKVLITMVGGKIVYQDPSWEGK